MEQEKTQKGYNDGRLGRRFVLEGRQCEAILNKLQRREGSRLIGFGAYRESER